MKIAVINQHASTGGWAYITNLIFSLKKQDTNLDFEVFCSLNMAEKTGSAEYIEKLRCSGILVTDIKISHLKSFKKKDKTSFSRLNSIINFGRKIIYKIKHIRDSWYSHLLNADVIFYSWPYGIKPLVYDYRVRAMRNNKVFFIPHDFIYTHCFYSIGGYSHEEARKTYREHEEFLKTATPIVSTDFIKKELKRTFPKNTVDAKVVYLPALNDLKQKSSKDIFDVLKKYNINENYIISANNWSPHKNLGEIVASMYIVRKKYPNLRLILTGYGTENMNTDLDCALYGNWLNVSNTPCVLGLGIVAAEDFLSLLQGAKLGITTSLCEAGSGMALDAWSIGTPMVMSDIESFRNQVNFLGTKAEFCNPRNDKDIARAILKLLDNSEISNKYASISKKAMGKYTWNDVAKQYLKIFKGIE